MEKKKLCPKYLKWSFYFSKAMDAEMLTNKVLKNKFTIKKIPEYVFWDREVF